MIEASSSFLVRDIARSSSSQERALSSFSLSRRDFSRWSSSGVVIRCNRLGGVLRVVNRDALPFGPVVSTPLGFFRHAITIDLASDAATVVLYFKEVDFRWKEIKAYLVDDF